jgi:hypothetical protein
MPHSHPEGAAVPEDDAAKQEPLRRKVIENPAMGLLYANEVEADVGPFDVRITLVEATPASTGDVYVKRMLQIVMPPESAKLAVEKLSAAIRRYENSFGKIRELPAASYGRTERT